MRSLVRPASSKAYSWNQRSASVAATSAGVAVAIVERHMIVPAARAARAIPISPSGWPPRCSASGATSSGIEIACPSTVVAVLQLATSTRTRGRRYQRPKAATLSRSVVSSAAPPA